MSVEEIQKIFGLKERRTFFRSYIQPALKLGLIEMTIPDKPNSRLQKYRLTKKGRALKINGAFDKFDGQTEQPTEQVTEQPTEQPTEQVTEQVIRLLLILNEDEIVSANDMMNILDLRHRPTFMYNYMQPAVEQNCIELIYPDSPNHPQQKYRLTGKGLELKKKMSK